MFKIVVFGSASGVVRYLKKVLEDGEIKVVGVVPRVSRHTGQLKNSQELVDLALREHIPVFYAKDINELPFRGQLANLHPDLLVNWGHGQIFKSDLLHLAKLGVLNFHPGMLPNGRGSGAIVGEILNNAKIIGQVAHLMNEKIDLGRVVQSRAIAIQPYEYLDEILSKLDEDSELLLYDATKKVLEGFNGVETEEFGRYFPKLMEDELYVDWNETSDVILKKVRSRSPLLLSRAILNPTKNEFLIRKVSPSNVKNYYFNCGRILDREDRGVLIKTGDNAIWIEEITFDGVNFEVPSFPIGTSLVSNWISESIWARKQILELRTELIQLKDKLRTLEYPDQVV